MDKADSASFSVTLRGRHVEDERSALALRAKVDVFAREISTLGFVVTAKNVVVRPAPEA